LQVPPLDRQIQIARICDWAEDTSLMDFASPFYVLAVMSHKRRKGIGRVIGRIVLLCLVTLAATAGCRRDSADTAASIDAASGSGSLRQGTKDVDHAHPVVRLETSQGAITLRLDAVHSPATVQNFLNYVGEGFYDNTIVHFVDAGKMIVAGGYTADHKLKATRPPIRNEAHNGLKNVRGTIAMARDQSQIDSATSQFFINLADAPQRDHKAERAADYGYCVFGEVIEGLEVAEKISRSSTADRGGDLVQTPDPPVIIKSVGVVH
jgi:cyclophilin family peptidyl-prolyl cis-trans isomerase